MENIDFNAIFEHIILFFLKVLAYFEVGEADPEGFEAWMNSEEK